MAGEIKLMLEGSDLDPASAIEPLTKSNRFKQVSILKRKVADASSLKRARELYKDIFQLKFRGSFPYPSHAQALDLLGLQA